ncbi:MBL fold metallo-hydrolase [Leucobacter denitrificans]|uniref:MBL fold metallo-hydrolase n=1 Tax=Leucobacter denitrificans TaxID=683042 RepID=A0A7G9S556_9MICO|nr:MBL fold metallo-hydrolase [Leucobacter denitrificans]QNN62981.1 MBL fold metallo-hydrolase [Leucobacter denitrificans]
MTAAEPSVAARQQHEAWLERRVPSVERVRPGLWSLPITIPNSPLRYVLIYVIELPDGIALVDTGWPHDESWNALESGLESIGFSVEDVRYVLITHSHTDHHGLTHRITERSGALVVMHAVEDEVIRELEAGKSGASESDTEWLSARGASEEQRLVIQTEKAQGSGPSEPVIVLPDILITDGDRPLPGRPDVVALWTPGHTRGHLCFHLENDRVLISGDHVLPRITPHVTRASFVPLDPALTNYLESLKRISALDVDEVLPAHEYRFSDLHARIDFMLAHHEERFLEILAAVRDGARTTWDVAERISWSRGWDATSGFMRQTALAETYTHLKHLEATGRVKHASQRPDEWVIEGDAQAHAETLIHQEI